LGLKLVGELSPPPIRTGSWAKSPNKGEYNWKHPVAGIDVSKDKLTVL